MGFKHTSGFVVETCCACGIDFAMTKSMYDLRYRDHQLFYCPSGHSQHYVGKTDEQRVKELTRELETANRQADQHRLEAQEQRQRAGAISRSYKRVRERVRNGVCPCCNRTFENLARHMSTKHPDYGTNQQLRTVRLAYGLSQGQLANEIGTKSSYISLYERGMELPKTGQKVIDVWLSEQSA